MGFDYNLVVLSVSKSLDKMNKYFMKVFEDSE